MTVAKHTHHTSRALAPFGYPEFAAEPVTRRMCRGFPYVGECTTPMARDNVANTLCASCLDRRARAICEPKPKRDAAAIAAQGSYARSLKELTRVEQAMAYRAAGWTWQRIADALDYYSKDTVQRACRAYRQGTRYAQTRPAS